MYLQNMMTCFENELIDVHLRNLFIFAAITPEYVKIMESNVDKSLGLGIKEPCLRPTRAGQAGMMNVVQMFMF